MKRYKFKSLRANLTFWFLLLALTPLLSGMLITYVQQKKANEQETFEKLIAIRDLKVERLKDWLGERNNDLQNFSADSEFADLEQLKDKTSFSPSDIKILDNSRRILTRSKANYPVYLELFIIDPNNGKVLISTNVHSEGADKSNEEFFTQPLKSRNFSMKDIYFSKALNTQTMSFSIPIFCNEHNQNHIVGVLVAHIDLQNSLYKMLSDRVGLGETGETLIVNKDVLALNELRWQENAVLKLKIDAKPAVDAANGKTGIAVTPDYTGNNVLAAFTYLPETKWGLVCKQELQELNSPIREMLWNLILLFIVAGILVVFIVFFISKSISKPIVKLAGIAKKIRAGDFSARNIVSSEDELGVLAREFNNMAEILETKISNQKGISAISETMIGRLNMNEFGNSLLKRLMKITNANMSTFYVLNEGTKEFEHFASVGANSEMLSAFSLENAQGEFGNALSTKKIFYLKDIPENTIFRYKTVAGEAIPKEIITIPIKVDNVIVAVISLVCINKFNANSLEILQQSWGNINTSYSNLIAGERTAVLAEYLSTTNRELEAQSVELKDLAEELQNQSDELQQTSEELQEQNIELETQKQQVESANKLKSEFLSNMSHELRTPLNSIMALSRVLILQAKNKLDEDESNYLEIIERNGKRLLSLINDILDLSKIEAGKMEILPEPTSLDMLLLIIKENLQSLSDEKGLRLTLNVSDGLPKIETDESKLYQVLTNIVGNAVKFTEKGSVEISAKYDTQNVFIEVKDTGIGISEDELPYVFDEFRQADGTSSRQYQGTGLGLAIADKIIKILGGTIHVKSKIGEGTVFTITMPIQWHEIVLIPQKEKLGKEKSLTVKETILVVDDDPKMVKKICEFLQEAGYETLSSLSGEMALKLAEKYKPYAITLDVVMPGMDGWEVLQKLKDNSKTKNIPVIVVSVSDEKDTGFALGAIGYVNKPVDKKLLMTEINALHGSPSSVMIVDDNEMDRNHISQILVTEKIKTSFAKGGEECIELLKHNIPDVLILDLMMPGTDGFQVLDTIRKIPDTKNLPVIVVTAKDLTKEDKLSLSDNVSAVISKSEINQQELFGEIKRILFNVGKYPKKRIQKNSILIVEDNQEAIIQIKTVLEKENYLVDVAGGGQEALDYIQHTIPSAIILDLMMPEIDGFEVLEKIRNTTRTKNIPVLILTAKDLTREDLSKLSSNNIQQLIQKGDVDIKGLLHKVNKMLKIKPEISTAFVEEVKLVPPKTKNAKPSVLAIEDNPDNLITIKAILKGKFIVSEAVSGGLGLELAQSLLPDIILLDMSLPNTSGEEVIVKLKENSETKNIPVIAVTALAMTGDKERFLNAGCNGYISKPIDAQKLIAEIGRLLV